MRRILALAVAAMLVAGALWLRDRDDSDSDVSAGDGDGTVELVCATEVADACDRLEGGDVEVRVEPAGDTAQALVGGEADLDAWLTLSPWPELVNAERERDSRPAALGASGDVLARSPLVISAVEERATALAKSCKQEAVEWDCIGEAAGRRWQDVGGKETWGSVRPVHPPPDLSAAGLAVLGQALVHRFGTTDISSADLEDADFLAWFTRLERAVRPPDAAASLVRDQLVRQGTYDFVGAVGAEAVPLLERAGARGEHLEVVYPSPMATAEVLLVGPARADDADAVERRTVQDALRATGWDPPGDGGSGLPDAGLMEAARALWIEVVR